MQGTSLNASQKSPRNQSSPARKSTLQNFNDTCELSLHSLLSKLSPSTSAIIGYEEDGAIRESFKKFLDRQIIEVNRTCHYSRKLFEIFYPI